MLSLEIRRHPVMIPFSKASFVLSDEEKTLRNKAIQDATKYAIEVPFKVMNLCYESMEVIKAMAETGNPNSVSDAGVGAIAALAGVKGAFLNTKFAHEIF